MSIEIQIVTPEQMTACMKEVDESADSAGLADMWLRAKAVEDAATQIRSYIGKKLAMLLPVPEGQKSKTHTVGDYKVGVKPSINYKIDWPAFDAGYLAYLDAPKADGPFPKPEKEPKRQLDEKGLQWIRENAKEMYACIAPAITVTPGATGIEIEHKPKKDK